MLTTSWGAKAARWAGAVLVTAASLVGGASAAHAEWGEMDPNEAVLVDHFTAAGPLTDPADGRLRGFGFAATIDQIGEASSVEYSVVTEHAPAGYKIVVFRVRLNEQEDRDYEHEVKGTVVIDGSRSPVTYINGVIAACVPVGAKEILFELASAGVAQTFSITEGKRVGPEPEILYRDSAWPDMVSELTAERVVKARDGTATAPVTIALKRVRLSWFSPGPKITGSAADPITTPSAPNKAFLIVEGEGFSETPDDPSTPVFKGFKAIPASDVRLKLPDGTTVAARHAGETKGLVGGAYYFEVPATLGSATLVMGPTSVEAERRVEAADVPTTARLEAATFKLTVPGGDAAQETEGNPDVPAATGGESESGARPRPTAHSSGRGAPVGLVALLVAVLGTAAGGVVLTRRRIGRADDEADPRPAAEPPAAVVDGPVRSITLDSLAHGPVIELGGPGALEAARAALLSPADAESPPFAVVLADAETARLVPAGAAAAHWLTVVNDPEAVSSALDVARVRAARLDDDADDGGRPARSTRVVVAVPVSFNGDGRRALVDEVERRSERSAARLLVVGGDGLTVREDGTVVVNGTVARLPMMGEEEALAVLGQRAPSADPAAAPPEHPRVDVRLLGPLRIAVDGREVTAAGRAKTRELLAFLALNRNGTTADAAMEALWPGAAPDGPYFRKILSDVRAVVREATGLTGDPIEKVGAQFRLDASVFDVDLWRFEDAVAAAARGDDEAAELAADVYAGDLLEGEDLLWADLARGDARRRAISNLTLLAERRRAAGDLVGALHAAEMAVERDPDVEEHYQRMMELCRDLGRPDGVRRAFEALETRLRRLGRTPSDKSRALRDGLGG
jgi:DNA-binding SARP family transcriptional activator